MSEQKYYIVVKTNSRLESFDQFSPTYHIKEKFFIIKYPLTMNSVSKNMVNIGQIRIVHDFLFSNRSFNKDVNEQYSTYLRNFDWFVEFGDRGIKKFKFFLEESGVVLDIEKTTEQSEYTSIFSDLLFFPIPVEYVDLLETNSTVQNLIENNEIKENLSKIFKEDKKKKEKNKIKASKLEKEFIKYKNGKITKEQYIKSLGK